MWKRLLLKLGEYAIAWGMKRLEAVEPPPAPKADPKPRHKKPYGKHVN